MRFVANKTRMMWHYFDKVVLAALAADEAEFISSVKLVCAVAFSQLFEQISQK